MKLGRTIPGAARSKRLDGWCCPLACACTRACASMLVHMRAHVRVRMLAHTPITRLTITCAAIPGSFHARLRLRSKGSQGAGEWSDVVEVRMDGGGASSSGPPSLAEQDRLAELRRRQVRAFSSWRPAYCDPMAHHTCDPAMAHQTCDPMAHHTCDPMVTSPTLSIPRSAVHGRRHLLIAQPFGSRVTHRPAWQS